MDWKVFIAAFTAVFFAELADKTQMAGISLSAKSGKPLPVLLGSVAAYLVITAVSVTLGAALAKYIKPEALKLAGGAIFILLGILILTGKL